MAINRVDITVQSLSALTLVHVAELRDGCFAWVIDENKYYTLVKNSGAVIDGFNVIGPAPGSPVAGAANARWIRQEDDAETTVSVANLAALAALDTTLFVEGALVWVDTLKDQFALQKTSILTANGITIVVPNVGPGRWIREELPALIWELQDTWHISPLNGNDENSGATALLALKTFREFQRRIGNSYQPIMTNMVVIIEDAISETVVLQENALPFTGTSSLIIKGIRTTIFSGEITSHINYDPVAKIFGSITDTGIPVSWTASGGVNQLIVLTSGANAGSYAWIMKDLTAKTARHSPFYNPSLFGVIDPADGDDYTIFGLTPWLGDLQIATESAAGIVFEDLNFGDFSEVDLNSGQAIFITCNFSGFAVQVNDGGYVMNLIACRTSARTRSFGGQLWLDAVYSSGTNGQVRADSNGLCIIQTSSVGQDGARLLAQLGGRILVNAPYGVADAAGAQNPISVDAGCVIDARGQVYGTGITATPGILVGSAGTLIYFPGAAPDFDTPATYASIGGTAQTRAAIIGGFGFINTTNDAKMVQR